MFFAALGESSSVRRHFLINLLIGLGLFALLRTPFVQQNRVVAAARDAVITWQMDRLTGLDQAPQLAWINIDDAAETRWGFQGTTPRDKLADLIAFAVRGQPKVVFVDIDLTDPVPGLERENAVLARYLQGLPHECSGTCPPVVLARMTGPSNYYYAGRGRALQTLPSFVDAPLGTSPARPWAPGNLRWGTINTDRDPDMVERHWRLWENSCTAPGSAVVTELSSGRVAAGTLQNPFMAKAIASGAVRVLGYHLSSIGPRLMQSAWFATSAYLTQNAAAVRTFAQVMQTASAYCNTHQAQTVELLASFTKMDPSTIASMSRTVFASTLDPALIQPLIDTAAKYKTIDKPFEAREFIARLS